MSLSLRKWLCAGDTYCDTIAMCWWHLLWHNSYVLVALTVTQWLRAGGTYCDTMATCWWHLLWHNSYVLVTLTVTQWLCAGDTYCDTMATCWWHLLWHNTYVLVTLTVTQWLCAGGTYCDTMAMCWWPLLWHNGYVLVTLTVTQWLCAGASIPSTGHRSRQEEPPFQNRLVHTCTEDMISLTVKSCLTSTKHLWCCTSSHHIYSWHNDRPLKWINFELHILAPSFAVAMDTLASQAQPQRGIYFTCPHQTVQFNHGKVISWILYYMKFTNIVQQSVNI